MVDFYFSLERVANVLRQKSRRSVANTMGSQPTHMVTQLDWLALAMALQR